MLLWTEFRIFAQNKLRLSKIAESVCERMVLEDWVPAKGGQKFIDERMGRRFDFGKPKLPPQPDLSAAALEPASGELANVAVEDAASGDTNSISSAEDTDKPPSESDQEEQWPNLEWISSNAAKGAKIHVLAASGTAVALCNQNSMRELK